MKKIFYTIFILLIIINSYIFSDENGWEEKNLKGRVKEYKITKYEESDNINDKKIERSKELYKFDKNGNILGEEFCDINIIEKQKIYERNIYKYDAKNRLIEKINYDNDNNKNHYFYKYNDDGNIIYQKEILNNDIINEYKYIYQYNEKNEIIETAIYNNKNNELILKKIMNYNNDGNLIEKKDIIKKTEPKSYYKKNIINKNEYEEILILYDLNNQITSKYIDKYKNNLLIESIDYYFLSGNSTSQQNKVETIFKTIFKYDKFRNLSLEIDCYNNELDWKINYYYNNNKRLNKKVKKKYHKNEPPSYFITEYFYDEIGNIIKEIETHKKNNEIRGYTETDYEIVYWDNTTK